MADLDSELHLLNSSSSKQRYSFAKSRRFQANPQPLCESIYELPSVMSKRATMLGYGEKVFVMKKKDNVPGVGLYDLGRGIDPLKNRKRSISFGVSREKMKFGDPLGNALRNLGQVPSPADYEARYMRSMKAPILKARIQDTSFEKQDKVIKFPGPGAYNHEELGSNNYYSSSKYTHVGVSKIPEAKRLGPIDRKIYPVGPADHSPPDSLNKQGRYLIGNHTNTNSCIFPRSLRKSMIQKDVQFSPGPGQQYSYHNLQQFILKFYLKLFDLDFNNNKHLIRAICFDVKAQDPYVQVEDNAEQVRSSQQQSCFALSCLSQDMQYMSDAENEEILFKVAPELKKNVAVFNCEVEHDNFSISFDEITGLYENKSAVVLFEIETQGTKVKIGQVQINLGSILNEKKYRIVNTFPLGKCYDKTAKAKLSVDFIPISAPAQNNQSERKEKREYTLRENLSNESEKMNLLNSPSANNAWKQSNYKSRLAEESNYILQEKIYEYEQKMDNYRLSQTQLQQKLHEQISVKDDHLSELTIEFNRRNQQIASMNLENEQLRFRIKEMSDELSNTKDTNRSLVIMVENLQHDEENLKKEYQSLKISLENQGKTKDNKEKYFTQELAKYTQRYLESQQQRNKIVFQLESKFKEQIEKKQSNYRLLISSNDKKHSDTIINLKDRVKILENQLTERGELLERQVVENKKINDLLHQKTRDFNNENKKYTEVVQEKEILSKNYNNQSHQLQTLNFSYLEQEREVSQLRDQINVSKKSYEQLRMELMMANQTIEEQRKNLTKYGKELQVHQERAYYLTEKYNDQLQMKSLHEENIRGESQYYRQEFYKLKNQLRIAEERGEEESHKNDQIKETLHRIQLELANKNQIMVRLGEEKIITQTENRNLKSELTEMEEALLLLKEENLQLNEYLRQKKIALQNDKSLEWSYKIEELQLDISEMLEKFKIQKDLLKQNFRKEENKRKDEISFLNNLHKKVKDENEELRRAISRRQAQFKDHDENNDGLRYTLKERTEELSECKQKMRIYMAQIEELENRIRQVEDNESSKFKELEEKHQKQLKSAKKLEVIKGSFNKIITNLLEYLTKPFSASLVYQEMLSADLDTEITNMINISLKKHCDQRNRVKETIKRLQNQSYFTKLQPKNSEKDLKYQQKPRNSIEGNNESFSIIKRGYFKDTETDNSWKYQPNQRLPQRDSFEIDSFREQNARLKREISELRVRIKNLEDDVVKAERNTDNERYAKEAVKHEIQELQDELEKVSFQLKRKEKIIIEYEAEMKDLQTEVLAAKNIQSVTSPKQNTFSRSEIRYRQKEEATQNSRNAIVIRDLEGKLDQKTKESQQNKIEINKLKNQVSTLSEIINNFKSQIKGYEAKLKERTNKLANQEEQLLNLKANTDEEIQRETIKQHKIINELEQQVLVLSQQCTRSSQMITNFEKQIEDLEKKLKLAKEQGRITQNKLKRENDQTQTRLKDSIQELQHTILVFQSQIQQSSLKNKEANSKISSLNGLLNKKNDELERLIATINTKNSEIALLQEDIEEIKRQYEAKIVHLLERVEELQTSLVEKDYELEEFRFTAQGRIMDLQKQLQESHQ